MRAVLKQVLAQVPGLLQTAYSAKVFYRQSLLDPIVTRRYRSEHPAGPEIARSVDKLDRDGYAVVENFFDDRTLAAFLRERDEIVARVEAGRVTREDLKVSPAGSYRLKWCESYGPTVEQRFFGNDFFEAVATHYLGGEVERVYKIFQRSQPSESTLFGTQGFHFDYERRTFKAFMYLSDVSEENGPIIYCPRTTGITFEKLKKTGHMHVVGINDELLCSPSEERRLKLAERAISLTGRKGTLLFVDTRGYHKAGLITQGHREVFVVYYGRRA